jgi:hypothetical protein
MVLTPDMALAGYDSAEGAGVEEVAPRTLRVLCAVSGRPRRRPGRIHAAPEYTGEARAGRYTSVLEQELATSTA